MGMQNSYRIGAQNVRTNQLQSSIPLLQSNERGNSIVIGWVLHAGFDYVKFSLRMNTQKEQIHMNIMNKR